MTLRASIVAVVSCAGSILLAAGTAHATIPLPDSGSCADGRGNCLRVTNTSTTGGNAIIGIGVGGSGVAGNSTSSTGTSGVSTSGFGVYGASSSNIGVRGDSTSSIGVYGVSSSGNGVVAQNNDTTMAAAAVSALAGNSNGLAYWGTGSIIITGSLAQKAGGGSWTAPSDIRIKRDVAPLRLGLDQLRQIRPVTYKYNGLGGTTDDGHEYVGVVAQELEKIFPNMVTSRKGKLHPSDTAETDIKVVDPSALTYVLINSVKEQQQIIDRQERRIAALEHGRGLSASMLGNGAEMALALGLLPLGFVALRRRKASKSAS